MFLNHFFFINESLYHNFVGILLLLLIDNGKILKLYIMDDVLVWLRIYI